jgi:hypothetical protein
VDSEQILYDSISGGTTMNVNASGRGYAGTTAATHADNAVLKYSRMLANGNDLRIMFDGVEVDRWLSGINTTTTKVWIAKSWKAFSTATITTAISNVGAVTAITVKVSATNLAMMKAANTLNNKILLIDSELFTFTGVSLGSTYQFTGVTRAQKGTSNGSHAVGATVRVIEHDIWMYYNNPQADAPVVNDAVKPLLDLSTSTNTAWVWTNYFDSSSNRPAAWKYTAVQTKGNQSLYYTGDQGAAADPATKLGATIAVWTAPAISAPQARIAATLTNPCCFTQVVYSGSKYAYLKKTYPAKAGLQSSTNSGGAWTVKSTMAAPTLDNTWQAFGPITTALGTGAWNAIAFAFDGTVAATVGQTASIQFDTITATLDNTKTPSITLGAEQSQYYLNAKIINTTTGEYMLVTYPMLPTETLRIDCNTKIVSYLTANAFAAIALSTDRQNWLNFNAGTNTLQFDDVGTGNVTIVVTTTGRSL